MAREQLDRRTILHGTVFGPHRYYKGPIHDSQTFFNLRRRHPASQHGVADGQPGNTEELIDYMRFLQYRDAASWNKLKEVIDLPPYLEKYECEVEREHAFPLAIAMRQDFWSFYRTRVLGWAHYIHTKTAALGLAIAIVSPKIAWSLSRRSLRSVGSARTTNFSVRLGMA